MSDVERLLRYLREPEAGTLLGQDEYVRDFGSRLWLADGADSWKVERMQFYDETGFPSWDAFAAGDWERSVELYDELRPALLSFNQQHAEHHAQFRRIRVVEAAISPYAQWEMYCLRVRSEWGREHPRRPRGTARRLGGGSRSGPGTGIPLRDDAVPDGV